jgi:hypothetical protein
MEFINKRIVLKSWNQGLSGEKANRDGAVSLGNFRLVNNLGKKNSKDVSTNTNSKWVSDSSDYSRFKKLMMTQKSIKR